MPRAPRVFVSYSHETPAHRDRVLALCDRLRRDGIDAEIDQYEAAPPEGWPRWTLRQTEESDFVLIVCTETYRRRFDGREERGRGLGVAWEGAVVTQALYDAAVVTGKFVPVLFAPEDEAHVPTVLRGMNRYNLGGEEGYEQLYRYLTDQPATPRSALGPPLSLPPKSRQSEFLAQPLPKRRRAWLLVASASVLLPFGAYLAPHLKPKQLLQGQVLEDGKPVPGVAVHLLEFDLDTVTDSNGKYKFEVPVRAEERVTLSFKKPGYQEFKGRPPAGMPNHVDEWPMRRKP